MLHVEHNGHVLIFSVENQQWEDNDLMVLREKYNVLYNGGIFAIRVIERKGYNPLYQLGMEDDGFLQFGEKNNDGVIFDKLWADDLKAVLDMAKNYSVSTNTSTED